MSALGTPQAATGQGAAPILSGWLLNPAVFGLFTTILTVAGAGTSLLAPVLLDPAGFGAFALVSTLFQVLAACDLGMSQLADRRMAYNGSGPLAHNSGQDDILALRWLVALVIAGLVAPLAVAWVWWSKALPPLATGCAIVAAAAFMANNGLVSLYRTGGQPQAFIRTALLMQFGMVLPRLGGLILGGVSGCFAALAVWYLGLAGMVLRPRPLRLKGLSATLKAGLPLFAFNGLWLAYLAAGRWISWSLSASETEFGLLAFGSSFVLIGTGLIANISQIRYPQILRAASRSLPLASRMMARDLMLLSLLVAGVTGVAIAYADPLIGYLFPSYYPALAASLAVSLSGLPLALVGWTLPLTMSLSRHILRDAGLLFGPVLITLLPMMGLGQYLGGIEGQAWALVVNAALLAGVQLVLLERIGVFSRALCLNALILTGLLLLMMAACVSHARAEPAKPYHRPENSTLSFEETFKTLDLWDGQKGRWLPHFPDGRRTIVTNHEREFYIGPNDADPLSRFNPFSAGDGLTITAHRLPAQDKPLASGLDYTSGMLDSHPAFSQTYGYFEIRAKMPRGRGLWPAFWLAPADQSWPPEIDVFEVHGHLLQGYWATVHMTPEANAFTHRRPDKPSKTTQFRIHTPDLSLDFHDYGVAWTAKEIIWTFDGQQVAHIPTPSELHKPMVLIVNLAVGGIWPGYPDAATPFPSALQVQHIRVYQFNTDKGVTP